MKKQSKIKQQIDYQNMPVEKVKLRFASHLTLHMNGGELKKQDLAEMKMLMEIVIQKGGTFKPETLEYVKNIVKEFKEKHGDNNTNTDTTGK